MNILQDFLKPPISFLQLIFVQINAHTVKSQFCMNKKQNDKCIRISQTSADICYLESVPVPLVSLGPRLYMPVVHQVLPVHPSGPHPLRPTFPALLLLAGHLKAETEITSRSLIKRSFKVTFSQCLTH